MSDTHPFKLGQRVQAIELIERFPHFLMPAGSLGTVTMLDGDNMGIRFDDPPEGAAEWDGQAMYVLGEEPRAADEWEAVLAPGERVRLLTKLNDPWTRLEPGDEGVVSLVDDAGTAHVNWDNGAKLGLIPGEDEWEVLPTRPATMATAPAAAGPMLTVYDTSGGDSREIARIPLDGAIAIVAPDGDGGNATEIRLARSGVDGSTIWATVEHGWPAMPGQVTFPVCLVGDEEEG